MGAPRLKDGTPFVLKMDKSNHQQWELASPTTGDQFVNADYWRAGMSVHYEISIVSTEANNL